MAPVLPEQWLIYTEDDSSINSFPGVGKLTVARELVNLLGGYSKARLVDNHLLIDPAAAVLPRSAAHYQQLRKDLRSAIFDALIVSPDSFSIIYIFTDFQSANDLGAEVCSEYLKAAERRGSAFVPITLTCSSEENLRRASSTDRAAFGKSKLLDTTLISEMRQRGQIYRFDTAEQLEIDTTSRSASDTAGLILTHLRHLCLVDPEADFSKA